MKSCYMPMYCVIFLIKVPSQVEELRRVSRLKNNESHYEWRCVLNW